jgi:acyl carrier protein
MLPEERREALQKQVAAQVGRTLRMNPAQIDPRVPFSRLGVDSLMGLEICKRLAVSLDLELPPTLLLAHPTITSLAEHLLGKLVAETSIREAPAPRAPDIALAPARATVTIRDKQLTDQEIAALLEAKLASLEPLLG